jgi:hypothetical protein
MAINKYSLQPISSIFGLRSRYVWFYKSKSLWLILRGKSITTRS